MALQGTVQHLALALQAVVVQPGAAADTRLQQGSSAPGETEAMVAACRDAMADARAWSDAAGNRASGAAEALRARARDLAG